MGKPKKSVVWEFFWAESSFKSSCNLYTFEVMVPDRSNYNFFLEIPVSVDTKIVVSGLVSVEILVSTHLYAAYLSIGTKS